MAARQWSITTRRLHLCLAGIVTLQLILGWIMEPIWEEADASALERFAYELHEMVGFVAVIIVLAHWIWLANNRLEKNLAHLYPWLTGGGARIRQDTQQLLNGQLPPGGPRGGLPGTIQGLGLAAVTVMALTGAILFLTLPAAAAPGRALHNVMEFHEYIANFVGIYWAGHVGMGLLHQLKGQGNLRRMFRPDTN